MPDKNLAIISLQNQLKGLNATEQSKTLMSEYTSKILVKNQDWNTDPGFLGRYKASRLWGVYEFYEFLAGKLAEARFWRESELTLEKDPLIEQLLYTTGTQLDGEVISDSLSMYFLRDDVHGASRLYSALSDFYVKGTKPEIDEGWPRAYASLVFNIAFNMISVRETLETMPDSRFSNRCKESYPKNPLFGYEYFYNVATLNSSKEGFVKPYGLGFLF